MGIFGPSDVIGISATIKKATYPGNAKSISKNSEIIKLYLRPLLEAKKPYNNEIQIWIREILLQHEQILRDKIDLTNSGKTENKLFVLLNQLIQRFGKIESQFCYFIPIHLTRSQIGKLTGSRVETIIRLMSRWKKQNLITLNADGIRIENLPQLEKSLEKNGRSK
jgi:CRP-like cAMP-binding protein